MNGEIEHDPRTIETPPATPAESLRCGDSLEAEASISGQCSKPPNAASCAAWWRCALTRRSRRGVPVGRRKIRNDSSKSWRSNGRRLRSSSAAASSSRRCHTPGAPGLVGVPAVPLTRLGPSA